MAESERTLRMQDYLADLEYPTRKEEIIHNAKDHDAPQDIINQLDRLDDKEYREESDILDALGMEGGTRGGGTTRFGKLFGKGSETQDDDVPRDARP